MSEGSCCCCVCVVEGNFSFTFKGMPDSMVAVSPGLFVFVFAFSFSVFFRSFVLSFSASFAVNSDSPAAPGGCVSRILGKPVCGPRRFRMEEKCSQSWYLQQAF